MHLNNPKHTNFSLSLSLSPPLSLYAILALNFIQEILNGVMPFQPCNFKRFQKMVQRALIKCQLGRGLSGKFKYLIPRLSKMNSNWAH